MQFQSLLSLWFGLTLPVIVLMYILKRKYIDTIVPSHLLWNRVLRNLEANSPWQKLRNNLLLILQLLIAAMLVLALMQPFVWSASKAKNHVVLVLDRSFSMETLTSEKGEDGQPLSRLEMAKREITRMVKNDLSGSSITLIAMGGQPDMLLSREIKGDAVLEVLKEVAPFYGKTIYKETMSLAAAITQDDKDSEIRVFTDGQWTDTTAGLAFRVPVKVVRVGEGQAENVRVVQFGVKQSVAAAASSVGSDAVEGINGANAEQGQINAVALLKNEGASKQELDMTLYNGSGIGEVRHETLQPGEQKSVYFDKLKTADYYKITINTNDALARDNSAFSFLSGDRTKKVLLVTEGNVFLEKALQLSHAEVTKMQAGGSGPLTPPSSAVDLIVLDSVKAEAIAGTAWRELLEQKPVWYIHTPAAPAQGTELNAPAAEYHITDHPVTQYIRLQDTHIAKLQQTESVAWGQAIVSIGPLPLVYAGFDKGQPRLLFTFDLHQSDLPLRSEFPVLVQNAVEWLGSRQAMSLGRAVAGAHIDIPVSGKTVSAEWQPIETIGKTVSAVPAEKTEGGVLSSQTVPNRPGLYQFVEREGAGSGSGSLADRKTYLEVTADPKETTAAPQGELVFAKQGVGGPDPSRASSNAAAAGEEQDGSSADSSQSLYSLVRWAALLVTILMLVEWGVYRRGTSI
jgi:hypothetical protein